ncbi:MAG: molecular chaperone GrpE [Bradymonadia bacterium]|jgi:molecular chaperone GrpE
MTAPENNDELDELFIEEEESVQTAADDSDQDSSAGDTADEELDELFIEDDDEEDDEEDDGIAADPMQARIDELEAELEAAKAEAAANHERLVRKAADLENARRRHQREKEDLAKYAAESVLKDVVPVLDDLQRAVDHATTSEAGDMATLLEGLDMVSRKFEQTIARRGVKAVESMGKPFDPQFHEAIQQRPDDTVPHNTVVQEFQRGYTIHDRLLRPAMVVVAQGGPPAETVQRPAEVAEPSNVADDEVSDGEASPSDSIPGSSDA